YNIGQEVADSLIAFLKYGATTGAVNFPVVDLPMIKETTRILNVHRNEPGVLGEINSVVSELGANIEAQYLSTDKNIGYMVMDVARADAQEVANRIKKLSRSIKTRIC